jgi:hypothetical protein
LPSIDVTGEPEASNLVQDGPLQVAIWGLFAGWFYRMPAKRFLLACVPGLMHPEG